MAAGELATTAILALAVGAVTTVIRLLRLRSAERGSEVAVERHLLERGWTPLWKRAHLDLIFIALGLAILGINRLAGGLSQTPIEGTSLALSFYVLLAPIFLWLGVTFLAVRVGAGDLDSTGGAGAVEAVAFVARSCHPMDGPPSGAHGRRAHARSVGGGIRHPGVGVRGDLSHRESD